MTTFDQFNDVTRTVKQVNPDLNSTDRVFETPEPSPRKVKVRIRESTFPLGNHDNVIGYVVSISFVDDEGRAIPKEGVDVTEAMQKIDNNEAPPDEFFEIGPEHSLTIQLDGSINAAESINAIVAEQIDRFANIQDKARDVKAFIENWSKS